MSEYVDAFVNAVIADFPDARAHSAQLRQLAQTVAELAQRRSSSEDLGIAVSALSELVRAAEMFSPWREHPKVTVFGSARVTPQDPRYAMAVELGAAMAERGWITVSGAGPGIMEAAARGAGRDHTLGVNIDLPFEQSANPYVDAETRLVETKYFFTRKVALTRESLGYVFFPGGLGTLDEAFEILTLLHTGKTRPAPVVLIDRPGGGYWRTWQDFMQRAVIETGYLDAESDALYRVVDSVPEAVEAVTSFYRNFVSFRVLGARGVVSLHVEPSDELLERLSRAVARFAPYRRESRAVSFAFDGRNYVSLRHVIDELNRP